MLGFPDTTSYEGGYDIICTLQIDVGCYHVRCESYYSATGALYSFSSKLKECYQKLEGVAEYCLLLDNDFDICLLSSDFTQTFYDQAIGNAVLNVRERIGMVRRFAAAGCPQPACTT